MSAAFLDGGGAAGAMARGVDWGRTPLGPPATWSEALRHAVGLVLASPQPLLLVWGDARIQFFNDACAALLAGRCEMGAACPEALEEPRLRFAWSPVPGGGALAFVTAVPDHAAELERERLHIEATARARLEAIVNEAPVAVAIYQGPQHVVELANKLAEEVIGAGKLAGRRLADVLPAGDNGPLIAAFDRVYQTGEPFGASNFKVRFATGSEHSFQMHFVPMRDPIGAITGVFSIGVEVTEVATARAEAERANRAKDEFLAILGHELRNPLAPILTALDLLRMKDTGATRELAVIERQAQHLVRLVDDLLDVSRIIQGKVELKLERLELAQVVARAIETATPLIEQRGHTLVTEVSSHGLCVQADLERLAQAIANLLTNAAKYTERGGTLTVSAHEQDHEVALSVRDTGIGIAPEMLPRVFEMFVQERQALDRAAGGLGLGLTIVRSLVALHGGRVEVASDGHARGSVFTIVLPLADARHEPPLQLPRTVARAASTKRVLLVDDNVDAAEMLAASLEMHGCVTRVAHDGPEALRVAGEFAPDVALLDIGLPVMDGYELAGKLRALLPRVRLIALTGYGQDSDRARSQAAGFDVHLVKPVSLDQVRDAVR